MSDRSWLVPENSEVRPGILGVALLRFVLCKLAEEKILAVIALESHGAVHELLSKLANN